MAHQLGPNRINHSRSNNSIPVQTVGYQTSITSLAQQTNRFSTTTTNTNNNTTAGVKRAYPSSENGPSDAVTKPTVLASRGFVRPAIPFKSTNKFVASNIVVAPGAKPTTEFSEYSQRKALASTPGPSQNPLLSLSNPKYGLPQSLVSNFAALGINTIYPWQASCLLGQGLLDGDRNLVYTAPTGGGKSLVADVLMLKKVLEDPIKKAILVVPYVALVQEKTKWLRRIVEGISRELEGFATQCNGFEQDSRSARPVRVSGFFGGSTARTTWMDTDIAVCTIEKANSLVNAAIEDGSIKELGVVVIDELHMLDDENRGYIMELMVTKLLSLPQYQDVQIIGMSATLSNTETIAKWIEARYFASTYRPIPIEEFLVYENNIYPAANTTEFFEVVTQLGKTEAQAEFTPYRSIEESIYQELQKPMTNSLVALAIETATAGYGALVFCSSRQGTQNLANILAEAMPISNDTEIDNRRSELIATMRSLPSGIDPAFETTLKKGVAFHHAGLTAEERELVAEAYDTGTLRIMVATCSLAAGINLPARRVILHGARMGREMVGPAMLRQMRGRAGRKGKDEVGETFLLCQKADLDEIRALLEAELPVLESCLTPEKRGIERALLESIATRLVTDRESIDSFVRRTLRFHTGNLESLSEEVRSTIRSLLDNELITKTDGFYEPTALGQAIVAGGLTPDDGLFVHTEMTRALQAFVMDTDIHVFYTFTPLTMATIDINWRIFLGEMDKLDDSGIRALRFIGINPVQVNNLVLSGGSLKRDTVEQQYTTRIYHRVYLSFQLRDLCNETPLHIISKKYGVPRGHVQNLAQSCHGFASGMIKFCHRLGWGMMAAVLDHMSDRLRAGARDDLLEMAQVTFVKSRMARMLWEAGFKSARALAEAEPKDLVPVLMQAQPRKSRLDDLEMERLVRKLEGKAEVISKSANRILERRRLELVEE